MSRMFTGLHEGHVTDPGCGKAEEDPVVISFQSTIDEMCAEKDYRREKDHSNIDIPFASFCIAAKGPEGKNGKCQDEKDMGNDGESSRSGGYI